MSLDMARGVDHLSMVQYLDIRVYKNLSTQGGPHRETLTCLQHSMSLHHYWVLDIHHLPKEQTTSTILTQGRAFLVNKGTGASFK